jgi:hypothetical protein
MIFSGPPQLGSKATSQGPSRAATSSKVGKSRRSVAIEAAGDKGFAASRKTTKNDW